MEAALVAVNPETDCQLWVEREARRAIIEEVEAGGGGGQGGGGGEVEKGEEEKAGKPERLVSIRTVLGL